MAIYYDDPLSLTFAALADPTRRAILGRLAKGDADVSELMKPFDLSQPTISKHLKVLERAGLIEQNRDAQRRPRTIVAATLRDVDTWLEDVRSLWEERFASLDRFLEKPKPTTAAKPAHRRTPRGKKK